MSTAEAKTSQPPSERGFWSLIVTQFQNAFSDNALRNLVIFLIVSTGFPHEADYRTVFIIGTSLPPAEAAKSEYTGSSV